MFINIKIVATTLPTILAVFGCLMIVMGLIDPRLVATGFVLILIAALCHITPYFRNNGSK